MMRCTNNFVCLALHIQLGSTSVATRTCTTQQRRRTRCGATTARPPPRGHCPEQGDRSVRAPSIVFYAAGGPKEIAARMDRLGV